MNVPNEGVLTHRVLELRRFASLDDLWRRTRVPQAALVQLAEADAFCTAFALARR